ncbi:MAG: SGNH/GDSL hydrolase family protein [Phycisphaerae bacterium]
MATGWKRLAAVGVGTAVGLALAAGGLAAWRRLVVRPPRAVSSGELPALRRVLDENARALYQYDPFTSYRFKPGFVGVRARGDGFEHRTNARGLLGGDELSAADAARAVLFLGDSVTYGDGVRFEECFVSQMQSAASGWRLVNAAEPGWSTHQEMALYEHSLAELSWRGVVLVFCLNDLVEFEWVFDGEAGFRMSAETESAGGLFGLADTAAGLRLRAIRARLKADPRTAPLADLNNTVLWAWDAERFDTYVEQTLAPGLARRGSRPWVVVAMPVRPQLRCDARAEAVWAPQRRLAVACERIGMPFIDAAAALAGVDPGPLYWNELHFTAAGHARVAAWLWPRLVEQLRLERGDSASGARAAGATDPRQ